MGKSDLPNLHGKESWGPGPWQDEPDRVEFDAHGLDCLMVRGPVGSWCGYVAVPKGHPAYGKDYDSLDIDVHGGLTYAGKCRGHVCHVPKPGCPDNVWWLGFDCAHFMDVAPVLEAYRKTFMWNRASPVSVYRTMAWVQGEVRRLAQQLVAMANTRRAGRR